VLVHKTLIFVCRAHSVTVLISNTTGHCSWNVGTVHSRLGFCS